MKTIKQAKTRATVDPGLRMRPEHAEEIARAVKLESARKGFPLSQNAFCVEAVLIAARKVLREHDKTSG